MAYVSQAHSQSFLERAGDFFTSLFNSIDLSASANARFKQVEGLNAKTDDELKEMGLRREDIMRHVFRDVYHI